MTDFSDKLDALFEGLSPLEQERRDRDNPIPSEFNKQFGEIAEIDGEEGIRYLRTFGGNIVMTKEKPPTGQILSTFRPTEAEILRWDHKRGKLVGGLRGMQTFYEPEEIGKAFSDIMNIIETGPSTFE
jgi:hypothetical protein